MADYSDSIDSNPGTMGDPRNSEGDTNTDLGLPSDPSTGNGNYNYNPFLQNDYSSGPGSQQDVPAYTNPQDPSGGGTATSFFDSLFNRFKQYGFGRGVGAVAKRAGDAAPLVGPAMAAYNAPDGKGGQAFGRSLGANTVNGMMYAINPVLGGLNSLWGAATGNTLGSWFTGNHANPNGFNQNTAASGGDTSRSGWDNALTGLAGLYAGNKANQTLKEQSNSLSGMYGQNSPYAQVLRSSLERKDAAAGRRSQAGSREVELQARLAEMASRNAPTIANLNQQRTNNNMNNLNSLMYLGRSSGLFDNIGKGISNWQASNNNPDYSNEGNNYPWLQGEG